MLHFEPVTALVEIVLFELFVDFRLAHTACKELFAQIGEENLLLRVVLLLLIDERSLNFRIGNARGDVIRLALRNACEIVGECTVLGCKLIRIGVLVSYVQGVIVDDVIFVLILVITR